MDLKTYLAEIAPRRFAFRVNACNQIDVGRAIALKVDAYIPSYEIYETLRAADGNRIFDSYQQACEAVDLEYNLKVNENIAAIATKWHRANRRWFQRMFSINERRALRQGQVILESMKRWRGRKPSMSGLKPTEIDLDDLDVSGEVLLPGDSIFSARVSGEGVEIGALWHKKIRDIDVRHPRLRVIRGEKVYNNHVSYLMEDQTKIPYTSVDHDSFSDDRIYASSLESLNDMIKGRINHTKDKIKHVVEAATSDRLRLQELQQRTQLMIAKRSV